MIKMFSKMSIMIYIFCALAVTCFAQNKSIIYNANTKSTNQFLVTITRPYLQEEVVYTKHHKISGNSNKENVSVEILKFNKDSGKYEPLVGMVNIGKSGLFTKQINLSSDANKIRLVAYYSNTGDNEFVPGNNLQISDYVIRCLAEDAKKTQSSTFLDIKNILKQLFSYN